MTDRCKRHIALIMSAILTATVIGMNIPQRAYAAQTREMVKVYVDNRDYDVRALDFEFNNNTYLSLDDLSVAFSNTERAFEVEKTTKDGETYIKLNSVLPDSTSEIEDIRDGFEEGQEVNFTRKRILIHIGENDYNLYLIVEKGKQNNMYYVNLGEFALAMNIDISCKDEEVYINSTGEFDFNKYDLLDSGISYMADSCLVGDANTGNIYYSNNSDEIVTIASTTKLMTYLIISDAMAKGEINRNNSVTFSKKASDLSRTSDGVIQVEEGQTANIMDVIAGMLIVSSNECSLALAEHLCGSEEAFVEKMNQKAVALGLSESVKFYNPHGLPVYQDDVLTAKLQNHMSANDMFKLASHIVSTYPEITEITAQKKMILSTLKNYEAKNTNSLLYNVPGVVGLKTGTTNKAGSCLVSAYETQDLKGETHYIITVVYGCENAQTQGYLSMVLMNYGIQKYNAIELGITPERGDSDEIPADLESMIGAVINTARKNSK